MAASCVFIEKVEIFEAAESVVAPLIAYLLDCTTCRIIEFLGVEDHFVQLQQAHLIRFLSLLRLEQSKEIIFVVVDEVKDERGAVLKLY